jgi:hypothetical protein
MGYLKLWVAGTSETFLKEKLRANPTWNINKVTAAI